MAADRSRTVDAANNLSHLVHPSEGCDCSRAETLVCFPVWLHTATVSSPKALSLVNVLAIVTLADFRLIRQEGWTEINPLYTGKKFFLRFLLELNIF